jgi:hypothetical protein
LGACPRIRAVKTVVQAIIRRGLLIAPPDSQ